MIRQKHGWTGQKPEFTVPSMKRDKLQNCGLLLCWADLATRMRVLCFIAVIAFVLLGCSRSDPFDRVMDYVSHESVPSYMFVSVQLPANATPQQLISALTVRGEFGRLNIYSGSIKIVETRSVNTAPPMLEAYTAVLLDTNLGQKIVLLQPENFKSGWHGWYWKIYDVKHPT